MKKIMFLMLVAMCIAGTFELNAKPKKFLPCSTNGSFSHNIGSRPSGMDEWTYAIVKTDITNASDADYYQTTCMDPGSKNCRTQMSVVAPTYDYPFDNGVQIYDASYLEARLTLIEGFIIENIQSGNSTSGTKSYNEVHNGYLIYQNATWHLNSDNTYEICITFAVESDLSL